MTVKELIMILEEHEADTPVLMSSGEEEVTRVSLDAQIRDAEIEWGLILYG